MPFPAIPVVIGLLGIGAFLRRDKDRGVMTPERTKVFNAALAGGLQDADKLDNLASKFEGEGLPEQAALLRQRAELKRLPNEVKLIRRAIWRKAIASKNKAAVLRLAAAYDGEGCTSAAMRLREIASGLPDQLPEPAPAGDAPEPTEAQPEDSTADSGDDESPDKAAE